MTVYRRPDPIPLHRDRPSAAFSLRRVKPEQEDLHHLVARQIFLAIIGGSYPEGSVLPTEDTLSQELGVSRTALREAVKGLSSKGILETRRRRGTLVRARSNWNMLDADVLSWLRRDDSRAVSEQLWQTIEALLPSLAGLVAQRGMTPRLRATRLSAGQNEIAARIDFILDLAHAAGNRFILSVVVTALDSLAVADGAFLEEVTRGITFEVARATLASIAAFDREGAEAGLRRPLHSPSATASV